MSQEMGHPIHQPDPEGVHSNEVARAPLSDSAAVDKYTLNAIRGPLPEVPSIYERKSDALGGSPKAIEKAPPVPVVAEVVVDLTHPYWKDEVLGLGPDRDSVPTASGDGDPFTHYREYLAPRYPGESSNITAYLEQRIADLKKNTSE